MKLINKITTLVIILFTFSACQKEEILRPRPEQDYPTTYKPLTSTEWNARNDDFQKINIHKRLHLDEYGFVYGEIKIDSLTKEILIGKLEYIVDTYQKYMGITFNINIENDVRANYSFLHPGVSISLQTFFEEFEVLQKDEYWPEIKSEFENQQFSLKQNKIENKKIIGSTIYFNYNESKGAITISGKWLPKIYIPKNEIYTLDDTTPIIYQTILTETGVDLWETKHTFNQSKTFIYIELENKITIHECWNYIIPVKEEIFNIYIDTQTGEVLKSYRRDLYIGI